MDLVSRENVLKSYSLANDAAWWRACSVGTRGCVSCMRPPRRDEYSRAPHLPVGCDSWNGQGAFQYVDTMQND